MLLKGLLLNMMRQQLAKVLRSSPAIYGQMSDRWPRLRQQQVRCHEGSGMKSALLVDKAIERRHRKLCVVGDSFHRHEGNSLLARNLRNGSSLHVHGGGTELLTRGALIEQADDIGRADQHASAPTRIELLSRAHIDHCRRNDGSAHLVVRVESAGESN